MVFLKEFIRLKILAKISLAVSSISASVVPATLDALPYGTPVDLSIPTPDGSRQGVHPDILCTGSFDPAFVLAFTPYPFSMDKFENPSILVSEDGLRFREEQKGVNPLVPAPAIDHNDDPDLFYRNGKWSILYLETLRPERQNLVLLESDDRLSWSSRILFSANLKDPKDCFMLSPAFIDSGAAKQSGEIFFVNRSEKPNRIEYVRESEDGSFDFHGREPVRIDLGGLVPWHVDILRGDSCYYMLLCSVKQDAHGENRYSLHIARSADLEDWELSPLPLLSNAYRSSGLVRRDDLFVYYSRRQGFLAPWRIGVCRFRLSDYFGDSACASR